MEIGFLPSSPHKWRRNFYEGKKWSLTPFSTIFRLPLNGREKTSSSTFSKNGGEGCLNGGAGNSDVRMRRCCISPFSCRDEATSGGRREKKSFGASWKFTNSSETLTQFYLLFCLILGKCCCFWQLPHYCFSFSQSTLQLAIHICKHTVPVFCFLQVCFGDSVSQQQLCLAFRPTAIFPPQPPPSCSKIYGRY